MGRRSKRREAETAISLIIIAGFVAVFGGRVVWSAARERPMLAGAVAAAALGLVLAVVALRVWHRRRVRARDDVRTLAALRQNSLTPAEFERALAALCRRDGCREVRVVGGAGDLGADVLAVGPDGERIVLQAKRYRHDRQVGSPDVQRFGGTCFTIHEAEVAAVVTTAAAFTAAARAYAAKAGILLLDARALAAWESRTGPAPWQL